MPDSSPKPNFTWRSRIASLGNLGPLFAMLRVASTPLLAATIAIRISRAVLPLALLWIPKLILDGIVAASRHNGDVQKIWKLLIFELMLALLSDILSRANTVVDSLLGDRFTNHVAIRLMDHAASLDLGAFEDPVFYDKLDRARTQAVGRMTLLASLLNLIQEMITVVILSAGMVVFSPWLVLLVAASTVPAFLGEAHFSRLAYSVFYRRTPQRRGLDYVRFLGTSAECSKELRIFGLGTHLSSKYRLASDQIYQENKELTLKRSRSGALLGIVAALGYYAGYAVVLGMALAGSVSIGTFTFLTGAFTRSRASGEKILGNFNDISEQAVLLTDLFEFFKLVPSIRCAANALLAPRPIRGGFEFRDVTFAYPGSERTIIRNINLRIDASERVALVGENGAGKTTVVKLLARLYDPVAGQVLLDGIDLREYDVADLRQQISVIFQDYMRYDLAIRENIGFGDFSSIHDDVRLRMAAYKSSAQALIDRFPAGYDQVLGRRFEGGADLSGGEWQKIALARAHIRESQLLILDEPTASLDARAEHEIFLRFSELVKGRMAVLISHRLSTARMADKIIVLEGGAIREQGTHEQLVQLGGQYAELFELQASGFRAESVISTGATR